MHWIALICFSLWFENQRQCHTEKREYYSLIKNGIYRDLASVWEAAMGWFSKDNVTSRTTARAGVITERDYVENRVVLSILKWFSSCVATFVISFCSFCKSVCSFTSLLILSVERDLFRITIISGIQIFLSLERNELSPLIYCTWTWKQITSCENSIQVRWSYRWVLLCK